MASRKGSAEFNVLEYVTSSEAAKMRNTSRAAINYLIKKGRLKPVRVFGRVLLHREDVLNYKPEKPGPKAAAKKKGAK